MNEQVSEQDENEIVYPHGWWILPMSAAGFVCLICVVLIWVTK